MGLFSLSCLLWWVQFSFLSRVALFLPLNLFLFVSKHLLSGTISSVLFLSGTTLLFNCGFPACVPRDWSWAGGRSHSSTPQTFFSLQLFPGSAVSLPPESKVLSSYFTLLNVSASSYHWVLFNIPLVLVPFALL